MKFGRLSVAEDVQPTDQTVDAVYRQLKRESKEGGYHLNPDMDFVKDLIRGPATDTGLAPAGWLRERKQKTWISSAPVTIAIRIWGNSEHVIAPCMFLQKSLPGKKVPNPFQNGVHRKIKEGKPNPLLACR